MKNHFALICLLNILLCTAWHTCFSRQGIKLACIGNSVTYGYGLREPDKSSYPAVLQKLLGGGYEVRNFGHSGATLLRKGHNPYYKTKQFAEALAFAPDIAVIHLGLNDTDPRNWPNYQDEFAPDYAWLIDTLRRQNPTVKIFICRLTPIFSGHPRFKSGTRDWYWQVQDRIPGIAKANHTGLIDLHTPLSFRPDLFADALHPDEEGAAIIAKTIYQAVSGNFGGLQLAVPFGSHMVLQRNRPVKYYGRANRGQAITAIFNKKKQNAVAGEDGSWEVIFPAMPAGGPYGLEVSSGDTTIRLTDILVGEVWLCSGQSNMAFPLKNAINGSGEMLAAEKDSNLRLLHMQALAETDNIAWDTAVLRQVNRLNYFSGTWHRSDSTGAKAFSAVAYYFARKLQEQLHVPVGLIELAVGGSTTESWIDRFTMEHDQVLVNELSNWRKSDFFQPWVRERADTNLARSSNPRQRHPYEPCYNYEAGISQFTRFPVAGAIWYQGESNAHNIELHEILLPALVKSWRKQWGYTFPFYYVQLSSLNRPSWTRFRYSQLQLLDKIPNSGMAVSSDLGDSANVHPRYKKEVGQRLAALALHFTYRRMAVVPYGPMPAGARRQEDMLVISFRYANPALKTGDGKPLRGFMLEDETGVLRDAHAVIRGREVVIPLAAGARPVKVLYGWKPFTDANLINDAGLPASTFIMTIK